MRPLCIIALIAPLFALSACGGGSEKTVVVTPPANSTTVVDPNGNAHTVPNN